MVQFAREFPQSLVASVNHVRAKKIFFSLNAIRFSLQTENLLGLGSLTSGAHSPEKYKVNNLFEGLSQLRQLTSATPENYSDKGEGESEEENVY